MAYDEGLAQRIRVALEETPGISERKMFGGICFMVHGNMSCGVVGDELMVRLGPEGTTAARQEPHTRPMDFTGRVSKNMVYVSAEGVVDDDALSSWVRRGAEFAGSLPPKG